SNNIAVVIKTAATNPASNPARIAIHRVTITDDVTSLTRQGNQIAHAVKKRCADASHSKALRAKFSRALLRFCEALGVRTRPRVAVVVLQCPLFSADFMPVRSDMRWAQRTLKFCRR